MTMFDVGLFIIRIAVGGLVLGHGLQKLMGWFGGPGVTGWAEMLESLHYRRPRLMSWTHALAETGAGLLLVFGLFTPLAVAAIIGVMLNAIVAAHGRNGLWAQEGGFEYPLVLGVTAGALALTGPGGWAVDTALGWELTTTTWVLAGIGVGVLAGLATLGLGRERGVRQRDRRSPGSAASAA